MHEAIKIIGIVVLLALAIIGISYLLTLPSKGKEEDIIGAIVTAEAKEQDKKQKEENAKLRSQHSKACGVVWAEFKVDPDIPKSLQIGVFKNPESKFPAWIRFSKATGDDGYCKMGGVGMAIKLMAVPGEKILESEQSAGTQDFLLFNSPVFFIRNIPDYLTFVKMPQPPLLPPKPGKLLCLVPFLAPRWHEASILIGLLGIKNKNLVERPY
jgi:Catalase